MISTHLWRALKDSSIRDPRFQRVSLPDGDEFRAGLPPGMRLFILALVMAGVCGGLRVAPDVVWAALFSALLLVPLAYITLNATVSGVLWAAQVAGEISAEQENGSFPVLATLPSGAAGASWRLCASVLARRGAFGSDDSERAWVLRIMLLLTALFGAFAFTTQPDLVALRQDYVIANLLGLGALIVAVRIDDIHAVVASGLVGMLAPTFDSDSNDTKLRAVLGFLGVQLGSYALTFLVGFVALPALLAPFGLPDVATAEILPLMRLAIFIAVREGVNRVLWHLLARRFATSPRDLASVTRNAVVFNAKTQGR